MRYQPLKVSIIAAILMLSLTACQTPKSAIRDALLHASSPTIDSSTFHADYEVFFEGLRESSEGFKGLRILDANEYDVWLIGHVKLLHLMPFWEDRYKLANLFVSVIDKGGAEREIIALRPVRWSSFHGYLEWLQAETESGRAGRGGALSYFPAEGCEFDVAIEPRAIYITSNCGIKESITLTTSE